MMIKANENLRVLAEGVAVSNDTQLTGLNNNDLIIGTSGSGKTGGYVIPNLQNITGSMVISDTKGQLCRLMGAELESKGYDVKILDFVRPQKSCGYNPLSGIRRYNNGKFNEQDILSIANTIMPVMDKSEPFWEKSASAYIAFLISFGLEISGDENCSMLDICDLHQIFIGNNGSLSFIQWAEKNPDTFAAKKLRQIIATGNADRMWSSIFEFANRALEPFSFEESRAIFENPDSFNILDLGRKKTVLFLNTSDTDRTFDCLANTFYTQALQLLCAEADNNLNGRLNVPVRIIMDDFASGTMIPDFDKIISVIRSRDISVSIILQSLTQLEALYGYAAAMTIINNCDHVLCLGSQDRSTAEYISYRVGKTPEAVFSLPRSKAVLVTSGEVAAIVDKIKPYSTISK